ncbi:putative 4Fe4S cluster binding protein [Sulfurospirillum multivorans DSM 12446]|uniref:4Fe4S cluster binding protein n=3 Tax=Sulfurospirillum multivorans TaxID=66821 RepID=A0AA86AK41_SULMK|nr:putative 4Fe4S cluster binding protein [Sulfurospirillum multivorans DSM 12446]QEH05671.1 putative 4Fe4S cluster binding protein [Sulfurospirillum multivorans]
MKGCPMLYSFTISPKKLLTKFTTELPTSDMAFACANCGLCAHMCPQDIDFGKVFTASKTTFADDKNVLKKYGYGAVIFHQKSSFSRLFSTTKKFTTGEYTHMAFMPGCALSSYSPSLVHSVFSYLRSKCSGIGIIQQCCGTPTRMMGDMAQFKMYHSQLERDLEKMGATTVVTACENCFMSIKTYAPHIKIVSLYSLLEQIGLPESAKERHKNAPKMALHDPCPTRYEKEIHKDVRTLLAQLGLPYEEFKQNREKTLCCGSGGMLELTHSGLAHEQMRSRANQTACESIVSYCQSCAESMSKGGKNGVHLLDLIFNPDFAMKQEAQGVLKKWYNRFSSRQKIHALKDDASKR